MSSITRYPLCWPDNVARLAPQRRSRPRFEERSIAAATSLVLAEINRLNTRCWDYQDESVVISTNLRLRQDGLPRSDQGEPADTAAAVYFTLRFQRNGRWHERPCVLSCDKWIKVSWNITAIGKDIEAQRARERWGCTNLEQSFRGYLAIPERCGGVSWWEMLKVPSSAGPDAIQAAYKASAKTSHPDVGGNVEEWTRLQAAYDQAMGQFR